MSQVTFMQATYQMILAKVPTGDNSKDAMSMIAQFAAPPGFRLHTVVHLKEPGIIGAPNKVLLMFEQVTAMTQDVPADANMPATHGNA